MDIGNTVDKAKMDSFKIFLSLYSLFSGKYTIAELLVYNVLKVLV